MPDNHSVILIVDDDPLNIKLLIGMLANQYEILFALTGEKACQLAEKYQPDLILLDILMPIQTGYQSCQILKSQDSTRDIPIIFITSLTDNEDEEKGLQYGAIDYIYKPMKPAIVKSRINNQLKLKHALDQLKQQATRDALTQLANRRRFDEFLIQEWQNMQRLAQPLSLIMIDIDYFKPYNDYYGHAGGDECLYQVATAMKKAITRPTDLLARYGGEEFVCILPATPLEGARHIAKKLNVAVNSLNLPHEKSSTAPHVTISLGVSCTVPTSEKTYAQLLNTADTLLYEAKESGRNCVVCHSSAQSEQE